MHIVVDERKGGLVAVDIAQLAADGLSIEERAIALLDGKKACLQIAPEVPEVDAGTVEEAVIFERLVGAPLDRRSADDVEAHVGICLPTDDAAIEAADHATGVARLTAEPGHQVPLLDSGLEEQCGDTHDFPVVVEPVFLAAGKAKLGLELIVAPYRTQVEAGEQRVLMREMRVLVFVRVRRQRRITQRAKAVIANVELRGTAGHHPGGTAAAPCAPGLARCGTLGFAGSQPLSGVGAGREDPIQTLTHAVAALAVGIAA